MVGRIWERRWWPDLSGFRFLRDEAVLHCTPECTPLLAFCNKLHLQVPIVSGSAGGIGSMPINFPFHCACGSHGLHQLLLLHQLVIFQIFAEIFHLQLCNSLGLPRGRFQGNIKCARVLLENCLFERIWGGSQKRPREHETEMRRKERRE